MEPNSGKSEARPPALIDRLVRMLVPPACREHVMGDLWERYVSPRQYAGDALRMLPFLIASQIRRNTNVWWLAIQAVLIFVMCGGPGIVGAEIDPARWIRVGVPMLAAICGLLLSDAYRDEKRGPARQALADIGFAAVLVLLSQGIVALVGTEFLASVTRLERKSFLLVLLGVVRASQHSSGTPRLPVTGRMSLAELARPVRVFEARTRQGYFLGVTACFFGTVAAGYSAWQQESLLLQAGGVLTAAGVAFAMTYLFKNARPRRIPPEAGFLELLVFYRRELMRQHRLFREAWWYMLPVIPGTLLTMIGKVSVTVTEEEARAALAGLAVACVILLLAIALNKRLARKLQDTIDKLATMKEERITGA